MKILHINRLFKILFGIILFLAIVLFAAPRIAQWYVVKNGKELTGRNIDIDKIRINYFTGTLRINNLKFYEADSLRTKQIGFLSGYLKGGQGFPPERFRIIETAPDSIMPSVKYT